MLLRRFVAINLWMLVLVLLPSCSTGGFFNKDHPLAAKAEAVTDNDRSGKFYILTPGTPRPATARLWQSASDWQGLSGGEKIDAIEAEQRRGNVVLIDGTNVYLLPETNLSKPEKIEPVFKRPQKL